MSATSIDIPAKLSDTLAKEYMDRNFILRHFSGKVCRNLWIEIWTEKSHTKALFWESLQEFMDRKQSKIQTNL